MRSETLGISLGPERWSDLRPVTISHGLGKGSRVEFDLTRTEIELHSSASAPQLIAASAIARCGANARRRALVRGHHDRRNERDPRPPPARSRRRAHSTCGDAYCPSTSTCLSTPLPTASGCVSRPTPTMRSRTTSGSLRFFEPSARPAPGVRRRAQHLAFIRQLPVLPAVWQLSQRPRICGPDLMARPEISHQVAIPCRSPAAVMHCKTFGNPIHADAILGRLVQNAHRSRW